jgi:hypothetical protein
MGTPVALFNNLLLLRQMEHPARALVGATTADRICSMNIKTLIVTCGIAVCLWVQPAVAGALEDGQAAFDRKDYALAVQIWRPLADQGDAEAQYNIGLSYMSDNLDEAARWYGLAADQGNAKSQFALGNIYAVGHGVPKDLVKAYKTTALGPHPAAR